MKAYVVNNDEHGFVRGASEVSVPVLESGEVLVKVHWSSVNYKDGLAATRDGKVVRGYPRILGIDLSGEIVDSNGSSLITGSRVIAHGRELGVSRDGGFAEYCAVPAEWIVPLELHWDSQAAMLAGTAGFTAAESVLELLDAGLKPDDGPVLVTGASGGVGSFAVWLLSTLGFEVVASTGRKSRSEWLANLGAAHVIDRLPAEVKSLEKERWRAVVDTVGGSTLSSALAATMYRGVVTSCGNTGGFQLSTTVFPFILRGIRLIGIDSANCATDYRIRVWTWLMQNLSQQHFELLSGRVVQLDELTQALDEVLQGKAHGRTLVSLNS